MRLPPALLLSAFIVIPDCIFDRLLRWLQLERVHVFFAEEHYLLGEYEEEEVRAGS